MSKTEDQTKTAPDELDLDAETVADLEVVDGTDVRGGGTQSLCTKQASGC